MDESHKGGAKEATRQARRYLHVHEVCELDTVQIGPAVASGGGLPARILTAQTRTRLVTSETSATLLRHTHTRRGKTEPPCGRAHANWEHPLFCAMRRWRSTQSGETANGSDGGGSKDSEARVAVAFVVILRVVLLHLHVVLICLTATTRAGATAGRESEDEA
jgi:hypothetical protein